MKGLEKSSHQVFSYLTFVQQVTCYEWTHNFNQRRTHRPDSPDSPESLDSPGSSNSGQLKRVGCIIDLLGILKNVLNNPDDCYFC